jgi:transcriptional regulator of PTS gene
MIVGSNIKDVKSYNRSLILKLICTNAPLSRSQIAKKTNLAKMTLSNIVAELISSDIIVEKAAVTGDGNASVGRRPILLSISENSPCICGMLIKRGLIQTVLADFRSKIIDSISISYDNLGSADELSKILLDSYNALAKRCTRKILAVSISSLGPVDTTKGMILNPPDFYGLSNIDIVDIVSKATGKPAYLINDSNAGALAEKIYGLGRNITNFVYLHMMNGTGAGVVLDNKLYEGNTGQSCELGHTSISFTGPKCTCGNSGCLDLYANVKKMNEKAGELKYIYPDSPVFTKRDINWNDYINYANQSDSLAMIAVDQFCEYVAYALTNLLNLLDINHIIIGYDCDTPGSIIEDAIKNKVEKSVLFSGYSEIEVERSEFEGNAPLIGSVAAIANRIFNCSFTDDQPNDQRLVSGFFEEA